MSDLQLEMARLTEDWDTLADSVQREAAALRYGVARDLARDGSVVDVACGTGFGLDHVAATAGFAVGGDVSFDNLRRAKSRSGRQRWMQLNAEALPVRDGVADLVTCFEAIYYLESIPAFLEEAHRILRPGGRLLVTFPNRERPGFSPSPGSHLYPAIRELRTMCDAAGFSTEAYGAFSWRGETRVRRALDLLRRMLSRLGLMPTSMAMRGLLKRLAYRDVAPLTPLETIGHPRDRLVSLFGRAEAQDHGGEGFLVFYGIATK